MESDFIKNLSKRYGPQFGKVAVDMGYINAEQLTEAISEQAEDSLSNSPHRFTGSILLEHGWITKDQIDFIVHRLFELEELIKWNSHSA